MIAATGIYKQPERLAYLVASSSTWQTLCSASGITDALNYVHIQQIENVFDIDDDTTKWPRSSVSFQDGSSLRRDKTSVDGWSITGSLTLTFELIVPPIEAATIRDAHNWFMNKIGSVINEMESNAGGGEPVSGETHLNVTGFQRLDGPWIYSPDELEILDPDNFTQDTIMWMAFEVEFFG